MILIGDMWHILQNDICQLFKSDNLYKKPTEKLFLWIFKKIVCYSMCLTLYHVKLHQSVCAC